MLSARRHISNWTWCGNCERPRTLGWVFLRRLGFERACSLDGELEVDESRRRFTELDGVDDAASLGSMIYNMSVCLQWLKDQIHRLRMQQGISKRRS